MKNRTNVYKNIIMSLFKTTNYMYPCTNKTFLGTKITINDHHIDLRGQGITHN